MTEATLKTLLEGITPPDEAARAAAHAHWASLAKPLGGLGSLETTLESAAALTGSAALDLSKRAVLVLCADNGVVAQGVSQTDQSVTRTVGGGASGHGHGRGAGARRAELPRCLRHHRFYPGPGHAPGAGGGGCCQGHRTGAGAESAGRHPAGHGRDGHWQHHHLQRGGGGAAGPACGADDRPRRGSLRRGPCPEDQCHSKGHCGQSARPGRRAGCPRQAWRV